MFSKKKVLDAVERTTATFGQAFIAVALTTKLNDLTALKTAAVAGGLAAAKYAYVRLNSYNNSADKTAA